jgi:Lsr2
VPEGTGKVARREVVVLEDDLEGGNADETVKFALDGVSYEIDLSAKNAARLRESFADFIANGRRVGRGGVVVGGRAAARARGSAAADREQNRAIRAWAKRKGRNISDRGRIPQEIVDEYNVDAGR